MLETLVSGFILLTVAYFIALMVGETIRTIMMRLSDG